MISTVLKFPTQLVTSSQELKDTLTLRDCFEKYVLPDMEEEETSSGTLSAYLTALNHWERRTNNPPVGAITNDLLRDFKQTFQLQAYSSESIKKYWRHIRRILRRIGPPIQGNPLGESIIDRVPYMSPPKRKTPKHPRLVSDEEMNALYKACEVATWPFKVPSAPLLWRLAIVVFFNCGPRTQDFFHLQKSSVDLKNRRILFLAQKTSKLQGIPFQEVVGLHFEPVLNGLNDSDLVFPATKCNRTLYKQWKKIQEAAGITDPILFQQLRQTCNSRLNAANPGANAGKWVLGHGPRGVNETFYHNPTEEVIKAVENLEQPESFYSILE